MTDTKTYAERSAEFAVYPHVGTGLPDAVSYVALGLVGESGELLQAIAERTPTIISEMGDVYWYLTQLRRELGIQANGSIGTTTSMEIRATEVLTTAAMVAEMVRKHLRDGQSKTRTQGIANHLDGIEAELASIAMHYGTDLSEVRTLNLAKLASRHERNVIHGDGDLR